MECDFLVDLLTKEAVQQCARRNVSIQRPLLRYMIETLLVSREKLLADGNEPSDVYETIYEQIFENGPVIRILKLAHYFTNTSTEFDVVQRKYEDTTKQKLISLLENICSFTGTSKKDQEEIFTKITIYIIASYKLFNTRNHEMLNEAKCALRSILSAHELREFVTRKKHYRISFLEKFGKIMCGILLFNKHAGLGGEAIRDVANDCRAAYRNTLESLRLSLTRINELITIGLRAIARTVVVHLSESKVIYKLADGVSVNDLELFNKYIYMHLLHEIYLREIKQKFLRIKKSIDYRVGQLKEVQNNLYEVVKFRLAVPTEAVFPDFERLFETWYQILMHLYYMVEINKINDDMTAMITTHYPYEEMASKIGSQDSLKTMEFSTAHMISSENGPPVMRVKSRNMNFFTHPLKRFCALSMSLSNGILIQSDTQYGVHPFQDQFLAYKRKDYGAFAEKHYNMVVKYFLQTAFENPEMCILYKIPNQSTFRGADPAQQYAQTIGKIQTLDMGLQTEHCLPPSTQQSKNTYSWNIWDYRRRAIQLANLRKCQTNATQTNITYSSKDANIQTYDKTSSTHRCICSSSQLSKSVCHIVGETEKVDSLDCQLLKLPPENEK